MIQELKNLKTTKKKATKTGFLSAAGVVKEEVEGQIRDGRQLSRREEKKQ